MRVAALRTLASRPNASDRQAFLKFLPPATGDFDQVLACLHGLAAVGEASDRSRIREHLLAIWPSVQATTASTYIALSSNVLSAIKDLLIRPTEAHVWAIVAAAMRTSDKLVWEILEPLLYNENDDIRRLICYCAMRKLSRKQQLQLLGRYTANAR